MNNKKSRRAQLALSLQEDQGGGATGNEKSFKVNTFKEEINCNTEDPEPDSHQPNILTV